MSHKVNAILEALDPAQYSALKKLVKLVKEKYPHVAALEAVDPLLMEGRAIMFNRETPEHVDGLDPDTAWAILVIMGSFTEGVLIVRRLGLRVRYIPGDTVCIRGHILPHEVEMWVGGQRISIVHFTHGSLWDAFGMECP